MATAPPAPPTSAPIPSQVRILSHSNIVYLWPIWFFGFIFGLIVTPWSGQVLAIVPEGTKAWENLDINNRDEKEALLVPKEKRLLRGPDGKLVQPKLHISDSKELGNWYLLICALVVVFATVNFRGLWSYFILALFIFLIIIFRLTGFWDEIVSAWGFLDVRINQGGYLFLSTVLFAAWFLVVFLYDRQIRMVFTAGQMRVRQEIGEGEMAYDATGIKFQRLRNDFFRHWVLGLGFLDLLQYFRIPISVGAGDLIVITSGAHPDRIEFPNVFRMDARVDQIERMLKQRVVVSH